MTKQNYWISIQIDPKKAERRDGKMFVGGVKPDTDDETVRGNITETQPDTNWD